MLAVAGLGPASFGNWDTGRHRITPADRRPSEPDQAHTLTTAIL